MVELEVLMISLTPSMILLTRTQAHYAMSLIGL